MLSLECKIKSKIYYDFLLIIMLKMLIAMDDRPSLIDSRLSANEFTKARVFQKYINLSHYDFWFPHKFFEKNCKFEFAICSSKANETYPFLG